MIDLDPFGLEFQVWLAIITSLGAITVWGVLFVRTVRHRKHKERRREWHAMWTTLVLVGLLASLALLATADRLAQQQGYVITILPAEALTFIASVGRGALLMGGLLVLLEAWDRDEEECHGC